MSYPGRRVDSTPPGPSAGGRKAPEPIRHDGPDHDLLDELSEFDVDLEEDSPFDRPTIIPSQPPEEFSLLAEAEGSAILLRKDRLAPMRLPSSLEIPPASSRRPSDPEQRRVGLDTDEIDMWGGGSRVPLSRSDRPRAELPTLHEDDPLAFDLAGGDEPSRRTPLPPGDDLSLDLDALLTEPMGAPSFGLPVKAGGRSHDDESVATATWRRPVAASLAPAATTPTTPTTANKPTAAATPTAPTAPTANHDDEEDERPSERRQIAMPRSAGREPAPHAAPGATGAAPFAADPPARAGAGPGRATTVAHAADPLVDMRDRFSLGDFTGSLVVAEGILESEPSHSEAARYADNCRERLRQMYAARLGSLEKVPRVSLPPDQVRWLSLDHRAGFILSCVDGYSSIEEILDVSGMPSLDALRILFELLQQRAISVD